MQIQVLPKYKYFRGVKNYHPYVIKRKTKKVLASLMLPFTFLIFFLSTQGGEWSKQIFFPRSSPPSPCFKLSTGTTAQPNGDRKYAYLSFSWLVFICSAVQMSCIYFTGAFQSKKRCHVVVVLFWERCSWKKQIFIVPVWSPASSSAWQMAWWQRSADV